MKIASLCRSLPEHGLGGMEVRSQMTSCGLAERGHRVHVFTTSLLPMPQRLFSRQKSVGDNPTVHYLTARPRVYSKKFDKASLAAVKKIGGFDLIHSDSIAAKHLLGLGLPVVVTWHGLRGPQDVENLIKMGKTPAAYKPHGPTLLKYAHHIVAGDHERDFLLSQGVSAHKITVAYHGPDPDIYCPQPSQRAELRNALGVMPGTLVCGVSGRLVFDKGVGLIAQLLKELDPRFKLLLVGEGMTKLSDPTLESRLIRVGKIPAEHMSQYYNAMDILLNPTFRHQGGPDLVIAEAMLCAVPVMVSDVGCYRKVLGNNRVFPMGDMKSLASTLNEIDEQWLKKESENARLDALRIFNKKTMLDRIEAAMLEVVANHTEGKKQ